MYIRHNQDVGVITEYMTKQNPEIKGRKPWRDADRKGTLCLVNLRAKIDTVRIWSWRRHNMETFSSVPVTDGFCLTNGQ